MRNPKLMLILASLFVASAAQAVDLKAERAQIDASYKSDLKVCMEFAKNEQADCKKDAVAQRKTGYQALWNQHQSNAPLPVYQGDINSQKKQIETDYQQLLSLCKELDPATQPVCKTEAMNRKKASLKTAMNAPASSSNKAVCATCGVVTQVVEVDKPGEGTWMGKIGGAAVGVGLGSLVGKGTGRTVAMVAGGLGGAYAGNKVEGSMNNKKFYEVSVKLDDGSMQTVTFDSASHGYKQGDKVRLENKQLVKR